MVIECLCECVCVCGGGGKHGYDMNTQFHIPKSHFTQLGFNSRHSKY